ncbi:MAG: OmpH family outer membrane protein [Pseudomonadota bacterium]
MLMWLLPVLATAQEVVSPVLTVDQDRLFSETRLGAEALAELEREAQLLAAENARIEDALIAEESLLTEQRATLDADEFRTLADEFDSRVQQFRTEQDEKARQLNRQRDEARAAFFNEIAVILSDIVSEKGAVIVIDRRDVFLSADRIDITDEAIERVNEVVSGTE